MNIEKEKAIKQIINTSIQCFVLGFGSFNEINKKNKNYPDFIETFNNSFYKVLENIGDAIAKLSYETQDKIDLNKFNIKNFNTNGDLSTNKDYWNFVCNEQNGFDIVNEQYQKSMKCLRFIV